MIQKLNLVLRLNMTKNQQAIDYPVKLSRTRCTYGPFPIPRISKIPLPPRNPLKIVRYLVPNSLVPLED